MSMNTYNNQESLVTDTPFLVADQYELRQRLSETVLAQFFYAHDLMSVNEGEQENTLIIAAVEPSLALYPGFEQIFPRVLAEFTRSDAPVHVVDACQSAGVYWIVFQANKGKLLSHHLQQAATHPLQATQTQTVLVHILRAVKHIAPHSGFGFIEPDAILYDGNRCQFLNAPLVIMLRLLSSRMETQRETLALHSPYISPEVAQGLPPTAQDDSFSIACIAYQLLQGTAPFAGLSSLAALTQDTQPAPLLHLKSETRASLQRALSLHRVERQASAYELVHAFTEIPTDSQQTAQKITPMLRRSALSIGAIVVTVVAGYIVYSPKPVPTQVAQIQSITAPRIQEKMPQTQTIPEVTPDKAQPALTIPEKEAVTVSAEKITAKTNKTIQVAANTTVKQKKPQKPDDKTTPPEKVAKPITITKRTDTLEPLPDRQTAPPMAAPHRNTMQRPSPTSQVTAQVTALQQNTFVVTTQAPTVNNKSNSTKQLTVKALPTDNNTFIVAAE